MDNVNYYPLYFEVLKYVSNDNTIRSVNNVVPHTVNTDDDIISEFNTKMNSDDTDVYTISRMKPKKKLYKHMITYFRGHTFV